MFLVNLRYQMGPARLMLDGTLPRFVDLLSTTHPTAPTQLESPQCHASLLDQSALCRISPNVWSPPRAAPAPMPPTRSRCARCRCGRRARRRGRSIRALRKRRRRLARVRRPPHGGGVDQRHRGRRRAARRARGGDGEGRARGQVRRPRRSRLAARSVSRARSARSRAAAGRRARGARAARRGGGACGQGRHQVGGRLRVGRASAAWCWRPATASTAPISAPAPASACRRSPARAPRWRPTTTISSALHAADLESPEKVGRTAGERAVARLNPRKVETTKVPVVYDRRVASSLIGHLAGAINGSAVARKTSFLKDKRGERLFRAGIRIIDDPLRKRGQRSRPFDGEGVAGKRLRADRGRRADDPGCSTARPRASSASPPPAMRSAACRRRRRRARPISISKPAR